MEQKLIYLRIADEIIEKIVSGEVLPNEKMESVRNMAIRKKVNPKTIQKAYEYLEQMNVFVVVPGDGRFVTSNSKTISRLKEYLLKEEIEIFLKKIKKFNLSDNELCIKLKDIKEQNE